MGDRTWLEFYVQKKDIKAFLEKLDELQWGEPESHDGNGYMFFSEANYGGNEITEEMAKHFNFHGAHGEGGDYGSMVFATKGGQITWCMSNHDGWPVVEVNRDGGLNQIGLANARKYWEIITEQDLEN